VNTSQRKRYQKIPRPLIVVFQQDKSGTRTTVPSVFRLAASPIEIQLLQVFPHHSGDLGESAFVTPTIAFPK
jgi:hypothetical protein